MDFEQNSYHLDYIFSYMEFISRIRGFGKKKDPLHALLGEVLAIRIN